MTNGDSARLQDEVQNALKRFHRAPELEVQAASSWRAVQARVEAGASVVAATRQVLLDAISDLEARSADARLLRAHYLQDSSIKALAADYALDVSSVYKRGKSLLEERALLVAERTLRSTRSPAAHRFQPRQPVVGLDALVAICFRSYAIRLLH